jgi:hypothetical protein
MFSSMTTYRYGARTVKVPPGASHSEAWASVTTGRPLLERHPMSGTTQPPRGFAPSARAAGAAIAGAR